MEFAKINTREIFCSYQFAKINTRKIQVCFARENKYPRKLRKLSTLKINKNLQLPQNKNSYKNLRTNISFILELWYQHRIIIVEITHKIWISFKKIPAFMSINISTSPSLTCHPLTYIFNNDIAITLHLIPHPSSFRYCRNSNNWDFAGSPQCTNNSPKKLQSPGDFETSPQQQRTQL